MTNMNVDLLVIGGGIHGAAIAADAAGRGLTVVLCEQDDLASATSSASSKLIHGGLRYLEQGDFTLVHHALKEREVLLRKAPHLIHPLEFVLPYHPGLRPVWLIRLGLFLYDHLARHSLLPSSKRLDLTQLPEGKPLISAFTTGFRYSDCWTDDARLVVLNALAAKEKGATVLTRTRCISAVRDSVGWQVELFDKTAQQTRSIHARAVVNAAGPWVVDILQQVTKTVKSERVRWVQGSHMVVPRLYLGNFAYILQNADKRVVFVIPYQDEFTLIGTTDVAYSGDLLNVVMSNDEKQYLCDTVNQYFHNKISPQEIRYSYSGVRTLFDDHAAKPAEVSRDYHLLLDASSSAAPLISVVGGKITTHRVVAEEVLEQLRPYFPHLGPSWTETAPLPGGDFDALLLHEFSNDLAKQHPWLPESILKRYVQSYGTRASLILADLTDMHGLGKHFGAGLYTQEVDYLVNQEWARTAEDILWRRTKLGLRMSAAEAANLAEYLCPRSRHCER